MFSSHQVADEALPCRKSTGTPSSGPLNRTRVVMRLVVMVLAVTPAITGMLIYDLLWAATRAALETVLVILRACPERKRRKQSDEESRSLAD
jgi:hypothetical protein